MDLQLTGRRALVTGSSSGIGAGIARTLAAEGARVVVHGRDAARTTAVAQSIKASVALGDLSTEVGAAQVADTVMGVCGGIDILVNNAGGRVVSGNPAWLDTPFTDWVGGYEQNVGSAVRMVQRFVPGMKAQGFGRVIQIASVAATQPEVDIAEYQAAKAAMVNLTMSLARTLAHTGVTVNTVSPGGVMTPALEAWMRTLAGQRGWGDNLAEIEQRFTREMIPLCVPRVGRPEDIGRMVAFLASPLSGYVTGADFRVDGGQCRSVN